MKAFTFEQLAVILIVVLGLIIIVVMIVTQSQKAGKGLSDISKGVTEQSNQLFTAPLCEMQGGTCRTDSCQSGESKMSALGCDKTTPPKGNVCCFK